MATEQDLLDLDFRRQVTDEITSSENDFRKEESRKRFDIWRGNLHEIIKEEMLKEYSLETVEKFRVQSSINLVPRIIKEKASIYKNPPQREFTNLNEEQQIYVDGIYNSLNANSVLRQGNQFFKLQDQIAIQVLPKKVGNEIKIWLRVLQPHHYDVIPMPEDPTQPMVYIINLNDENRHIATFGDSTERKQARDFINQEIADWDDQRRLLARFAWWSENFNFITDGFGEIKSDPENIINPLGRLSFIDVANQLEKDFRFWVFKESLLKRFQIDFAKDLTDLTENIKMQGFATGLLIATKKPNIINIGPRKMMFLPLDPNNPDARPSFDFKTPSPDISAQMQVIQDKLAMYLTSDDIDPKTISGKADANTFSSGIERLLAQIQRFEATKDDIELFKGVERKLFDLLRDQNNFLATQNIEGFEIIPDDADLNIEFSRPEKLETQRELEERWITLRNEGLATNKRAIMEIYHVSSEKAEEIMKSIEEELMRGESA